MLPQVAEACEGEEFRRLSEANIFAFCKGESSGELLSSQQLSHVEVVHINKNPCKSKKGGCLAQASLGGVAKTPANGREGGDTFLFGAFFGSVQDKVPKFSNQAQAWFRDVQSKM